MKSKSAYILLNLSFSDKFTRNTLWRSAFRYVWQHGS